MNFEKMLLHKALKLSNQKNKELKIREEKLRKGKGKMVKEENLKKLEQMKSKVKEDGEAEINLEAIETVDIEEVVKKVLNKEFDVLENRLYKGLSNLIRFEIKVLDNKVSQLLQMAELDGKQAEILEIWDKINKLTRGSEKVG